MQHGLEREHGAEKYCGGAFVEKKGNLRKGHIDLNGLKTDMKEALRAASAGGVLVELLNYVFLCVLQGI